MIRLRTLALGAALVLGAASTSLAQGGPGNGPARGMNPAQAQARMMDQLFGGIELKAEQKTKIEEILTKQMTAGQEIRSQIQAGTMDRAAAMQKNQENQAAFRKEMRALLTDDQAKAFDANIEKMEKEMQERRLRMQQGGGRPPRA